MNKASKHWLAGMTIIVVVSLMLAGCNVPGSTGGITPTPEVAGRTPTIALSSSQGMATPTRPVDNVQHIIERIQANLAATNIQSYVVTETYSARAMVQGHDGMSLATVVSGSEQLQTTVTVWHQQPKRWRVEAINTPFANLSYTYSWPPLKVSDGQQLWRYDPQSRLTNVQPITNLNDPANDASADILTRTYTLLAGLNSNCSTPPVLAGIDTVLGRAAYMINPGGNRCPDLSMPGFYSSRTLWFDKQTGLLLKDMSYNLSDKQPLDTWQVTGLQLNVAINPSIFTFTPPLDARIVDNINFHLPYPTPAPAPANQYQPTSITLAEARQRLPFPVFIPTTPPAGLTAEQPTLIVDGSNLQSLTILYHNAKGLVTFEVLNSTPDPVSSLATHADETVTLANGITAYYRNDGVLYWEQDGAYIAIGAGPHRPMYGSGCSWPDRDALVKIANSMSKTANLGRVEAPIEATTPLARVRQQVCYPVFIPTYLPAAVTTAHVDYVPAESSIGGVQVHYYTTNGATAFSIVSNVASSGFASPFATTVIPIQLPNGITARYFERRQQCGYGQTTLYWQQDGALLVLSAPPPDAGGFQLTKDELIKIAVSVSSTAELGKTEYPTARPTELPQPEETAPSCTPPLPQAVPSHGPVLPVVEPTNHP